jgi:hypothetical protein
MLMNQKDEHNGHFQMQVSHMSVKKAIKLCKKLEKYTKDKYMFYVQVFVDGSWTIYQGGYFQGRPGNLADRMILSCDNLS